jgi:hypothetical protein
MRIVSTQISLAELKKMAENRFGDLVKAVIDVERKIMAVDAELHSDEEALLLESGSLQKNLWGINIYPEFHDKNRIEFDSIINIRPSQANRSRNVDDPEMRKNIIEIVRDLIKE